MVEYNLSESGVHPLRLSELLDGNAHDLLNQPLGYPQTNGSLELRKTIAALYSRASPVNILVTNGSSEANFVTMWSFLAQGAEVVIMLPNYMQIWGLAKTFKARVRPFWLRESNGEWSPDLRALGRVVSRKTKLIAVCNPNNPTGAVMREETVDQVCRVAKKVGAWVLSDEVYHGAELDGRTTPTFWDKYERVVVTNSLSKAYGLPGLRLGWIVSKGELSGKFWAYHDYTTISPTALSDYLARRVLQPDVRTRILVRTRKILQTNLPVLRSWVDSSRGKFSFISPEAGAIAYLKYRMKINSSELANRLVKEKSTLVVPGDHFGMDGYVRIGYGSSEEYLRAGLNRIGELTADLE
jgi:aspartate/methionine/tyrosine aminotransferase